VFSANSRQAGLDAAGSRQVGSGSSLVAVQDRLKPPVSVVNMEHKVIKLGGSKNIGLSLSTNIHTQNSQLKQPVISESAPATHADSNAVVSNSSRKIRLSQPGIVSATVKAQLQRNAVDASSNPLPAKRMSISEGETEKKKFKATAITWP